jgi:hypothetical protein
MLCESFRDFATFVEPLANHVVGELKSLIAVFYSKIGK